MKVKRKGLNMVIHTAIDKLDDDDKELVNELYFKNTSVHQLAKNLRVSRATIRYRRDRALERLKKLF